MPGVVAGRPNQKSRTRKDLLQAAARLLKLKHAVSLEEVAAEALVSRATAYRYFPSIDALLLEASLDVAFPDAEVVFRDYKSDDPVARVELADAALQEMLLANERALRMMLMHSLERGIRSDQNDDLPARQNRRSLLIDAALEPVRNRFRPAALASLRRALALIIGTEAMVVFKDVLRLDEAEARKVRHWAIRALVGAALK